MYNILIISLQDIKDLNENSLYVDLYRELSKANKVDILSYSSNKKERFKKYNVNNNAVIHKVYSSEIFRVNKIKKALNLLKLNKSFKKVVKKQLKNKKYDLVLYSTPPITLNSTIRFVKKYYKAKTYLLLKDIFPQNAVDLEMFRRNGLIYWYFRRKELNLYKISDYIGTMSLGNMNFIIKNNPYIDKEKVELNYNSVKIQSHSILKEHLKNDVLENYKIPTNKTTFIYGGNLGVPQGVEYIKEVLSLNRNNDNHIIIVGDGTEANNLESFIYNEKFENVTFIKRLPKEEYDILLKACDVGLIFLDKRFTIPNIPSRLLSYLDYGKPVISATDVNTDLKDIIDDGNFGYWCESENPKDMIELFEKIKEKDNIKVLGDNGRKYLEDHYNVKDSARLIIDKMREG